MRKDPLLSEFDKVICLEPTDSVDLEKDGILMPESVDVYGDWFVIRKTGGENNIVLLNPGTGESIGCFKTGRGPGEVINIGSVQILGDSLYVYDVSRAETSVLDLGASIRERRQVLVRAAPESFSGGALLRPFRLYRYPGGVMVAGLFDDGTWYASFDGEGEEYVLGQVQGVVRGDYPRNRLRHAVGLVGGERLQRRADGQGLAAPQRNGA